MDEIILNGKYESKSYHEAIPTAYQKDCIIRSQLRALLPTQSKTLDKPSVTIMPQYQ